MYTYYYYYNTCFSRYYIFLPPPCEAHDGVFFLIQFVFRLINARSRRRGEINYVNVRKRSCTYADLCPRARHNNSQLSRTAHRDHKVSLRVHTGSSGRDSRRSRVHSGGHVRFGDGGGGGGGPDRSSSRVFSQAPPGFSRTAKRRRVENDRRTEKSICPSSTSDRNTPQPPRGRAARSGARRGA